MLQFQPQEHLLHSYIVASQSEQARDRLSLDLAAAMLCRSDGVRPCRACRDCRKVYDHVHPDVIYVEPDRSGKAPVIKVDQIRSVAATAYILPSEAEKKVYVLRQADTMNLSAQNAFLKLLEEPPAGWVIILLAANVNKLLPTIMSRVVQLRFQALEPQLVEQALQARQIEPAKAAVLARISEGSIGLALNLAAAKGQLDVFECRKQAAAFLEALPLAMPMNYLAGRSWLDKKVQREQALLLVQLWQLLLRDLMMCKLQLYDRIYNIDLLDELKSQSSGWQLSALKQALVIVQEAYDALVSSVGMKTALETMALKIDKIYKE